MEYSNRLMNIPSHILYWCDTLAFKKQITEVILHFSGLNRILKKQSETRQQVPVTPLSMLQVTV